MATTLGELRSRILRLLGDPEGAGYSGDLLLDGIVAAMEAILPWMPKTARTLFTGDGNTVIYALPSDLYETEAVVVNLSGEVLPRSVLSPGQKLGLYSTNVNQWIEYPSGSMTFAKALRTGEVYDLYYLARWTKPTTTSLDSEVLETPDVALTGLTIYAAAYVILPTAIGVSELNPFKTRVDSGNPTHNPMQDTALYLLDLFAKEMNRHPKHQKATK